MNRTYKTPNKYIPKHMQNTFWDSEGLTHCFTKIFSKGKLQNTDTIKIARNVKKGNSALKATTI